MGIKQAVAVVTREGVTWENLSRSEHRLWRGTLGKCIPATVWTVLFVVELLSLLSCGGKNVFVPFDQLGYDQRVHGLEVHILSLPGEAVVDQRECREVEF
jgi:hypothetical protein